MADKLYLFASCNFIPDYYRHWQAAYDQLAKYVFEHEPTTMTYYFGIPMDYADDFASTTSMLAFEIYGKREDLYETHLNSSAMTVFLDKALPTMTTGLDLNHYALIGGYLDSSQQAQECAIMLDTRFNCKSFAARKALAPKLKALADAIQSSNEGVLTFMVFDSLDDELSGRIFARFTSRRDMDKHLRRKEVVGFWLGAKEKVDKMESRAYLPNRKGWLHREVTINGAKL